MRRRLLAIMRKEFVHVVRDWRSLLIVLLMPVLMIVLYGYAITMEMRDIRFAVFDDARTPASRALVASFTSGGFFLRADPGADRDIPRIFRERRARMVLLIPHDFDTRLASRGPGARGARVQVVIDASDSNAGTFIATYSEQAIASFSRSALGAPRMLYELVPRVLYNPAMESSDFFVPGLVALILMLISALLTSIAITREKETGTMEQILVSPVHPVEIILGKVLPYIVLGLVDAGLILIFSRVLFDVPFRGSFLLLSGCTLLYVGVALSMGLLFSTVARTQLVAMFMTLMATLLPTMILSGFIFPVASMPPMLQLVSKVMPATHYLVLIRSIMMKRAGVDILWPQIAALAALAAILLAVATKRFKTRLD